MVSQYCYDNIMMGLGENFLREGYLSQIRDASREHKNVINVRFLKQIYVAKIFINSTQNT